LNPSPPGRSARCQRRASRGPHLQAKRPSEFGQRRQQLVSPAEHLDHDVIGPGPQMLA
jgi:hypothetical protein